MIGKSMSSIKTPRGNVAVIGQGHVGLRVALRAAEVGWQVAGYDVDEGRVKELRAASGSMDGIDRERLRGVVEGGSYMPTARAADVAGFDVAVIAVPTPVDAGAIRPDMSHVEDAARLAGAHLRAGAVVSVESTVYPGATEEVVRPLLEAASGLAAGTDFHLGHSPERIDTGNSVYTFENTPKLVSGVSAGSLEALAGFYSTLVESVVKVPGVAEAELAKIIENTFREVNVAFVNEIAAAAAALGIDAGEAFAAAATKPFGFLPFTPGPGAGGHCLVGAATYLAWMGRERAGSPLQVVEASLAANRRMTAGMVQRIHEGIRLRGGDLAGSRVLLLGLAYKAGVSQTESSPAVALANALVETGAEVMAADPYVGECRELSPAVARVEASGALARQVDAVVLLVDHPGFDLRELFDTPAFVLNMRPTAS